MESQPQNPEFRNNPENFHPLNRQTKIDKISISIIDNMTSLENIVFYRC